jgi:hypothetical protein
VRAGPPFPYLRWARSRVGLAGRPLDRPSRRTFATPGPDIIRTVRRHRRRRRAAWGVAGRRRAEAGAASGGLRMSWRRASRTAWSWECTPSSVRMLATWLRSARAAMEAIGDRLGVEPVGERLECLVLAGCEAFDGSAVPMLCRAPASREAEQLDHLVEIEHRLAGPESPDGVDDLVDVGRPVEGCRGAALESHGRSGRAEAGAQHERQSARVDPQRGRACRSVVATSMDPRGATRTRRRRAPSPDPRSAVTSRRPPRP